MGVRMGGGQSFVNLRIRIRGRDVPLCLRAPGERCTVMHKGFEEEIGISLVCFYLSYV